MAQQSPHALLGGRLREARLQSGLTQARLACSAGVNASTVRLLEAGRGTLTSLDPVLVALSVEVRSRQLRAGPLGPALKILRMRRGLSQRLAARTLGVARNTLATLEVGGPARIETLAHYADELGAELTLVPVGTPVSFHTGPAASSVHHGWKTPLTLAGQLDAALGPFDLDPCAASRRSSGATVQARRRLTIEDDGLEAPWCGLVFVNPPYGRSIRTWVEKCAAEAERPGTTVVALLAVRTDTRWWHDFVAVRAAVCFLRGRLRFGDGMKDAPFASAIVVWNGREDMLTKLKGSLAGSWSMPND